LCRPQERDLGADERAVGKIERQHREARMVAGPFEIRIEEAVREDRRDRDSRGPSP
jgi:hypothetical protein